MALMTVDIDAGAFGRAAGLLQQESARIERALRALTQRRAKLAKEALQRATPVSHPQGDEAEHSPHMRDLWHQETTGPSQSIVFNEAPYSSFLFSGTAAHTIRARNAGALRFFDGGSVVFAHAVEHPGTLPSSPLLEALERQLDKAQDDLFGYGVQEMAHLAATIAEASAA